ncbi:MAG: carbon starvation protein A, partial [Lentisphaeria bacterium]|nr:carbon starvation protein A [Lentisphaeria bacterium]
MLYFIAGLLLLAAGYFFYGKLVERLFGPDDRPVPSETHFDGVDFLPLPHWKNMLIQLLNIAGIGPVIGVILGIKFGEIVFLIIPIGNIIGGAVHDYFAGMMSIRDGGANMPSMIRKNLGNGYARFFSWFMVLLLLLVVAVFINIPAQLLSSLFAGDQSLFWLMVMIIFAYYIAATLFPVDKIIGAVYPIFGAVLILSAFAILGVLLYRGIGDPALLAESAAFRMAKFKEPIL